jgi:hypothetical protein
MHPWRWAALGSLGAASILTGTACGVLSEDAPSWHDQLVASSPCYRVDLLDGLDEQGADEVHDLFDCVNYHGHFEPLADTVDALDASTRSRSPAALEVARMVNRMPSLDVDPFALAGLLTDALRADDRPIDEFLNVLLELFYGTRANRVRSGAVQLDDPAALQLGILGSLAPVAPIAARSLLNDDLQTAKRIGESLSDLDTRRWIWTFESLAASDHPDVQPAVSELLVHMGQARTAAFDATNDRWSGASGDSLRDGLDAWFLADVPVISAISDEADTILADAVIREALPDLLVDLDRRGHLRLAPEEIAWLATVDKEGNTLQAGQVSALHAFIRLLAKADHPLHCELDLWLTEVELISLDNLALTALEVLAKTNPDTLVAGSGFLGSLFDDGVTEWILHAAVDAAEGTCDGLTHEIVDDLEAVGVLTEPPAYDILVLFIEILDLLKHGEQDRLPELMTLATDLFEADGIEPTEELLRDLAPTAVVDDILALVPVLADPVSHGIKATTHPPVDVAELLGAAEWAFSKNEQGLTGWERARALVLPVLEHEATWVALDRTAGLLEDDRTQMSGLLHLLPPLVALDPNLDILDQLGPLLEDDQLARPLLEITETGAVIEAFFRTERMQPEDPEPPVAFVARLVVHGTLDDLLSIADLAVDALLGDDED